MPAQPRKPARKVVRKEVSTHAAPRPNLLPDAAFQFVPCLEDIPNKGPDFVNHVQDGLRKVLGPDADVHYAALNLTGTGARTGTLGIWFTPPKNFLEGLTRADSLKFVKPVSRHGNCWMYINSNFINRQLQEAFAAKPHRVKPDGTPDANGPIHIFQPTLSFEAPARVVTSVPGLDERPLPDVKFTIRLIDDLSPSKDRIVSASQQKLDKASGVLSALTAIGMLTFLPAGLFFLYERIRVGLAAAPVTPTGAGAQAARLLPPQIMIEGGDKVSFVYDTIQADETGLKTSGAQDIVPRVPSVGIIGPKSLKIGKQNFASGKFQIAPVDLRPDLTIHWKTTNGSATPQKEATRITFGRGSAQPGTSFNRTVRVDVTDADGLTASASTVVRIVVPDTDEDDQGPVKPGFPKTVRTKRRARS